VTTLDAALLEGILWITWVCALATLLAGISIAARLIEAHIAESRIPHRRAEVSAYPEGLYSSDYCYMEGHIYPDSSSPDPAARAAVGTCARSTCSRCGQVNYGLRAFLGAETRRNRRLAAETGEQR